MKKNLLFKKNYAVELVRAIRGAQGSAQLRTLLSDYHEHDIAEALTHLTPTERGRVVAALCSTAARRRTLRACRLTPTMRSAAA